MTGRELIIYILQNGLEDEEIVKDGKILGFTTIDEVAIRTRFGRATIKAWIEEGLIDGVIHIGEEMLIPETSIVKFIGSC